MKCVPLPLAALAALALLPGQASAKAGDVRTKLLATLVAPDGMRALPVFSGIEAVAAWDPEARPVPVTPARAGQAAVSEGCEVIVVDVAGPATRFWTSSACPRP